MITGDFAKWVSIGAGVGIEVRGDDLVVTVVKVRPHEVQVIASTTITRVRERPAADWGAEYGQFLRKVGCGHLAATVLLPRDEIIVRQLSLPGVGSRDLDAAVRYQVDTLHPYPEGEVTFGWARLPGSATVLIGIARTEVIERYALLFGEAGVRTASLTFSAAIAYSAVRILNSPPENGFLVVGQQGDQWEAYGESPSQLLFSATFDLPYERAVSLAAAELRLPSETPPLRLLDVLPVPKSTPNEWDQDYYGASYATALAGACPWLALAANLLPAEQRSRGSRAVYIPTAVLSAILLVVLGALGIYGGVRDRSYQSALSAEIARYTSEAAKVSEIDAQIQQLRARRETLRSFRTRTKRDLDALLDLTYLLGPPAWLKSLQLSRSQVMIVGQAPHAALLLEIIDGSPRFRNSEFTSSISAAEGDLENFTIRIQREDASRENQP